MRDGLKVYFTLFVCSFFFSSCYNTYYISAGNLHTKLTQIKDTAYAYHHKFYDLLILEKRFDNGITQLTCTNKKGDTSTINVSPRTEVKLVLKDGEKNSLFFRTLYLKDSLLFGQQTFFVFPVRLNYRDIDKITIKNPRHTYPEL